MSDSALAERADTDTDIGVVLLCPKCEKRLPLTGPLCLEGRFGVFCRHCHRKIRISVEVADESPSALGFH